ncbi:unnamed protein product [Amoebophrya sp. A120]|nr:unnamed protein product [Amoebophrya sp. A120]|eukprot:GSA120T00022095001.1
MVAQHRGQHSYPPGRPPFATAPGGGAFSPQLANLSRTVSRETSKTRPSGINYANVNPVTNLNMNNLIPPHAASSLTTPELSMNNGNLVSATSTPRELSHEIDSTYTATPRDIVGENGSFGVTTGVVSNKMDDATVESHLARTVTHSPMKNNTNDSCNGADAPFSPINEDRETATLGFVNAVASLLFSSLGSCQSLQIALPMQELLRASSTAGEDGSSTAETKAKRRPTTASTATIALAATEKESQNIATTASNENHSDSSSSSAQPENTSNWPWLCILVYALAFYFSPAFLFVLAGLVILVAVDLITDSLIQSRERIANNEWLVLLLTALFMSYDIAVGVPLGLVFSLILFVFEYSQMTGIYCESDLADARSCVEYTEHEKLILWKNRDRVQVLFLHGYLFFGSATVVVERVRAKVREREQSTRIVETSNELDQMLNHDPTNSASTGDGIYDRSSPKRIKTEKSRTSAIKKTIIILDFSSVPAMDANGVFAIAELAREPHVQLVVCGLVRRLKNALQNADFGFNENKKDFGYLVFEKDLDHALENQEKLILLESRKKLKQAARLELDLKSSVFEPKVLVPLLQKDLTTHARLGGVGTAEDKRTGIESEDVTTTAAAKSASFLLPILGPAALDSGASGRTKKLLVGGKSKGLPDVQDLLQPLFEYEAISLTEQHIIQTPSVSVSPTFYLTNKVLAVETARYIWRQVLQADFHLFPSALQDGGNSSSKETMNVKRVGVSTSPLKHTGAPVPTVPSSTISSDDDEILELLAARSFLRVFEKDSSIYLAGDPASELLILLDGYVEHFSSELDTENLNLVPAPGGPLTGTAADRTKVRNVLLPRYHLNEKKGDLFAFEENPARLRVTKNGWVLGVQEYLTHTFSTCFSAFAVPDAKASSSIMGFKTQMAGEVGAPPSPPAIQAQAVFLPDNFSVSRRLDSAYVSSTALSTSSSAGHRKNYGAVFLSIQFKDLFILERSHVRLGAVLRSWLTRNLMHLLARAG